MTQALGITATHIVTQFEENVMQIPIGRHLVKILNQDSKLSKSPGKKKEEEVGKSEKLLQPRGA